MHEKLTDELLNEIKTASDVEDYIDGNAGELLSQSLPELLAALLREKGMTRAALVRASNLDKGYLYQIFSGEKTPSRDKLLAISVGFAQTLEETQRLLKCAGHRALYPRDKRDAVLLFCLERKQSICETNLKLTEVGEKPLD